MDADFVFDTSDVCTQQKKTKKKITSVRPPYGRKDHERSSFPAMMKTDFFPVSSGFTNKAV
jgi:hypothetical protein